MSEEKSITEVKSAYFDWLNMALEKIDKERLKGLMICLYENDYFQAQVLAYESVDTEDVDWACNWVYDEKVIFDFESLEFAEEWEDALDTVRMWTDEFISSGQDGAKAVREIGILALGFADGDIEFLYPADMREDRNS